LRFIPAALHPAFDPQETRQGPSVVKLTKGSDEGAGNLEDGEPEAYWLELPEGVFLLDIDGKTRAGVVLHMNVGEVLGDDYDDSFTVAVPDSDVVFDIVEDIVGRANEFRTVSGPSQTDWRSVARQRAESFSKEHPPEREAQHYCATALRHLDEKARHVPLGTPAQEARDHLQDAVLLVRANNHEWTREARDQLAQAKKSLEGDPLTERLHEPFAYFNCAKALIVVERERRQDNFPVQAPLSAAPQQPALSQPDASPLASAPDACWMELGFDHYRLLVDGQERAAAYARLKTAAIPDPDTHRLETIVALDSETIFEAVEKRVGLPRVTAFTPEDRLQDRIELEKDAAIFREMCAPHEEPEFYVWDALNCLLADSAGPTDNDLESARDHLGKALEALKEGDDPAEAAKQVDHARQYLPSLTDSPTDFKPHIFNAIANCDRAAQAIERNCSLERGGGELSHAHSTGPSRGRGRH
jgi:hypothetical protein